MKTAFSHTESSKVGDTCAANGRFPLIVESKAHSSELNSSRSLLPGRVFIEGIAPPTARHISISTKSPLAGLLHDISSYYIPMKKALDAPHFNDTPIPVLSSSVALPAAPRLTLAKPVSKLDDVRLDAYSLIN